MPFIVTCTDRPGAGDLRQRTRAVHLEYMIRHRAIILFGGPLLDEDGDVTGSVMVLDLADRAAVDGFLRREPYTVAGLFSAVHIHAMRQMVPERFPGLLEGELALERGRGAGAPTSHDSTS